VCVQACRVGRAWAFQCHPETSGAWVNELAAGIRGEGGGLLDETTRFFVANGVSADALEHDLAIADVALDRLAAGIASGFAAALDGASAPRVGSARTASR
jgi:hypothetical protein